MPYRLLIRFEYIWKKPRRAFDGGDARVCVSVQLAKRCICVPCDVVIWNRSHKKSIQLGVYTKKCEFESIILSITSFVDREMRDASVFQCARGVCAMTSTAAVGGK